MAREPERRIARLRRRSSGNRERPFYFTTDDLPTPRGRRSRTTFIDASHVPPFEDDEGWFLMARVKGTPWDYWRAVEQVDPPKRPGVPAR